MCSLLITIRQRVIFFLQKMLQLPECYTKRPCSHPPDPPSWCWCWCWCRCWWWCWTWCWWCHLTYTGTASWRNWIELRLRIICPPSKTSFAPGSPPPASSSIPLTSMASSLGYFRLLAWTWTLLIHSNVNLLIVVKTLRKSHVGVTFLKLVIGTGTVDWYSW